ncbi:sulfotransferase family protein [Frateuria aurantia]
MTVEAAGGGKTKPSRLIVVLGAHRSGTSAITRGLRALGVNLGKRLIAGTAEQNAKGFWEDLDLNSLNVEMMSAIGHDWCSLSAISLGTIELLVDAGYLERALTLLQTKTAQHELFGFKDPRLSKMLPFWKRVFAAGGYEVAYVLAIRNPLSVAMSLHQRDKFRMTKSHLLWLGHVIPAVAETAESPRVVVDYDRVISQPAAELTRIADGLGLDLNRPEIVHYQSQFLDATLRHATFSLEDLEQATDCPALVKDIYPMLLEAATDAKDISSLALLRSARQWQDELARMDLLLNEIDALETFARTALNTLSKRRGSEAQPD